MSITTTISLLLVSLIGLTWWIVLLALAIHAKGKIDAPKTRGGVIQGFTINLVATFLMVAPLLIILWKAAMS
jgi:hypothetical protein